MATKNPDGTRTSSHTYKGVTTTTVTDASGRIISRTKSDGSTGTKTGSGTSSGGNGYNKGSQYSNRETEYRFKDGQVYYGPETNWQDAAKAAGNTSGLSSAVTYYTGGDPNSIDENNRVTVGFTTGKTGGSKPSNQQAYDNAMNYEKDLMETALQTGNNVKLNEIYERLYGSGYQKDPSLKGLDFEALYDLKYGSDTGGGNLKNQQVTSQYPEFQGMTYEQLQDVYGDVAKEQAAARRKLLNYLNDYYSYQEQEQNDKYDEAARQAYITKMQTERNMPRLMAAQGLNGGAAESSLLRAQLNYENNINQNEQNRNSAIAQIALAAGQAQAQADSDIAGYQAAARQGALEAYQNTLSAQNSYNLAVAQLEQAQNQFQAELAYQNMVFARQQEQQQRAELQDKINLAYQLGDYKTVADLTGYDVTKLEQDAQIQQQLNQLKLLSAQADLYSTPKTTGGSVKKTTPILTYAQTMEAIDNGNYAPNVLEAYEYYLGEPFSIPVEEETAAEGGSPYALEALNRYYNSSFTGDDFNNALTTARLNGSDITESQYKQFLRSKGLLS